MNIIVEQTWHGWCYWLIALDGSFTCRSKLSFSSKIAALTMAHFDLLEHQLWQWEKPTAFFDIDTGEILSANNALRTWLGIDPIGHRCDKLPAIKHFTTELLPVGNRIIGSFQILLDSKFQPGWNLPLSPLQGLLRFRNFARYSSLNRKWLAHWASLPPDMNVWESVREIDLGMKELWHG